jgi:hypothetical protein
MRALHLSDLAEGFGEAYLPFALSRKYRNAAREWAWQYVFASHLRSLDPRSERESAATTLTRKACSGR